MFVRQYQQVSKHFNTNLRQDSPVTEMFASCEFVCGTNNYNKRGGGGVSGQKSKELCLSWIPTRQFLNLQPIGCCNTAVVTQLSKQSTGCSTLPGSYTTISAFCHWAPRVPPGVSVGWGPEYLNPAFCSAKTANIWFLRAGTVGEQSVAIAKAATILPYCRDKRRSFQYKYTWKKVYKYNKICLQWALDCKQMNENFISNGNRPPSSPPRFSLSWYPPKWSHPKLWFWTSDSRRDNCLKCWENKWKQHKKGRWGVGGKRMKSLKQASFFLAALTATGQHN